MEQGCCGCKHAAGPVDSAPCEKCFDVDEGWPGFEAPNVNTTTPPE